MVAVVRLICPNTLEFLQILELLKISHRQICPVGGANSGEFPAGRRPLSTIDRLPAADGWRWHRISTGPAKAQAVGGPRPEPRKAAVDSLSWAIMGPTRIV